VPCRRGIIDLQTARRLWRRCNQRPRPADLIDSYPRFYWDNVSPHIQLAIRYLNISSSGRQWIANLYGNVFSAEHDVRLSGPEH